MSSLELAVYGTSASLIANTIVYPLDLAKTVIQTQLEPASDSESQSKSAATIKSQSKEQQYYESALDCILKIAKKDGPLALYQGLSSSLIGGAIQSFSYFYWYSFVRQSYAQLKKRRQNGKHTTGNGTIEELLLGIIAASIGQFFTSPVSVIATKQQTEPLENTTILQTAKNIIKEDGITGFWRGLKVSLVLTINPSITYASYERLKKVLFKGRAVLLPHENFVLGVLSKMLATLITQPLIIAKAMLQKSHKFGTFQSCLAYLVKHEGIAALWKGLGSQLSKGVLVQGFIFMFKEQLFFYFRLIAKLLREQNKRKLI
ncbi:hypothetical protein WICPIJ_008555 [Wickerhamomyces pijperi]|uniref:Peroxisomal adenine nucleotide transporter 1 n=1 Tax=Wickerhamomyces pijperi TaxID=599730 RepID=A0A9P8PWI9_WICPI|nr:hypothetical protein WICPIJ_008555 [Wickerhamomyces pijperi]